MQHLTTLDACFLHAEDSDRNVSLAIGGVVVLDGPMPDHDSLMPTLAARIGGCPRLAQRLRRRPLDLGAPEWVDDDSFDIAHHLRRVALPRPGEDRELYQLVADVMALRLDRSRPLWEIWVIEGLPGDRWAMLMKVHHCIADGIATAHMLAGLSDRVVGDSFAGDIRAAHAHRSRPGPARPTPGTVDPMAWVSGLFGAPAAVVKAALTAARGTAELTAGLLRPAGSPLNGPIGSLRRYSAARVSLADVRQVCDAFDVTINDVALAAITESYRALLTRRGEKPAPESLRTLVPVSMRSTDAFATTDNRVSVMLPYLPVEEKNPVARLRAVHARLSRTKVTGQRQAVSSLFSMSSMIPFPLAAATVRLLTRLPQRGVVTLTTNVPGPREPLTIMGCPVTGVMPIPPIAMQLRTGVAMLSYGDDLYFGILADFDAVPDIDELARGVPVAVARLVARSTRRQPARERRGPSLVTA
ncbi:wax ester/triacylglycerol synthase family O-acyltransferase [Mycobacterium sp.]|uniref:WS/DGAT/MGAT family O-acyltransferase n=1 Tax=Mycobacterium sp. TaxID=1785 RepID=UPI0031D490FD